MYAEIKRKKRNELIAIFQQENVDFSAAPT
jgi:hypothetical protein